MTVEEKYPKGFFVNDNDEIVYAEGISYSSLFDNNPSREKVSVLRMLDIDGLTSTGEYIDKLTRATAEDINKFITTVHEHFDYIIASAEKEIKDVEALKRHWSILGVLHTPHKLILVK